LTLSLSDSFKNASPAFATQAGVVVGGRPAEPAPSTQLAQLTKLSSIEKAARLGAPVFSHRSPWLETMRLNDPEPLAISLTRIRPLPKSKDTFSPAEHFEGLNRDLADLSPVMTKEIQSALPKALRRPLMTELEVTQGLETLCQQIKETPVHINFICKQKFFNEQGQFWPSGRYLNRALWYEQEGYHLPQPRPFEPQTAQPEYFPIYGALNLGMMGHGGWGSSCFVLKPSACHRIELRSRDTGQPEGVGAFAVMATRDRPLPIIADWIRMRMIEKIWQALISQPRGTFTLSPSVNTEAAIFSETGYLSAKDIAIIVLSQQEADDNGIDLTQLKREGQVFGVPVVCHDAKEMGVPFEHIPEYQAVMAEYKAHSRG